MDNHDNDQSAADGDLAANESSDLERVQSDFSTILALLFRRFDFRQDCCFVCTDAVIARDAIGEL